MCISTFWYFALIFSLFLYHRYYTKARDVLYHYSHMPSFHGIHQDCDEIVKQLIVQLREQLRNPKVMTVLSLVHVSWLGRMEPFLIAFLFFHLNGHQFWWKQKTKRKFQGYTQSLLVMCPQLLHCSNLNPNNVEF